MRRTRGNAHLNANTQLQEVMTYSPGVDDKVSSKTRDRGQRGDRGLNAHEGQATRRREVVALEKNGRRGRPFIQVNGNPNRTVL